MKGITKRQQEVLQFVWDFLQVHHYQPATEDIMKRFNYKSPASVTTHFIALKNKGYVERKHQARAVILTGKGLEMAKAKKYKCLECGSKMTETITWKCECGLSIGIMI